MRSFTLSDSKEEKSAPTNIIQDLSLENYENFYDLLLAPVEEKFHIYKKRLDVIRNSFKNYLISNREPAHTKILFDQIKHLAAEGFFAGKILPEVVNLILEDVSKRGEKLKALLNTEEGEDFISRIQDKTTSDPYKTALIPKKIQTGVSVEEVRTITTTSSASITSLSLRSLKDGVELLNQNRIIEAITLLSAGIAAIDKNNIESNKELWATLHHVLAKAYNEYGNMEHESKNFTDAISHYKTAIKLLDDIGLEPNDHRYLTVCENIADSLNSHGDTLYDEKKYEEAIFHYQLAAATLNKVNLNENNKLWFIIHDNIAVSYGNQAIALCNENRFLEAIAKLKLALEILTKIIDKPKRLAEQHSNLSFVFNLYGNYLFAKKDFANAIIQFKLSIEALNKLGPEFDQSRSLVLQHNLANAHNNYGQFLYDNHDFVGAIDQYKEAIKILNRMGDNRNAKLWSLIHSNLVCAYYNYGNTLLNDSKVEEAIKQLELGVEILSTVDPIDNKKYLLQSTQQCLVRILNKHGCLLKDYKKAIAKFEFAIRIINQNNLDPKMLLIVQENLFNTYISYCKSLLDNKMFKEAIEQCHFALQVLGQMGPHEMYKENYDKCYQALGFAYESMASQLYYAGKVETATIANFQSAFSWYAKINFKTSSDIARLTYCSEQLNFIFENQIKEEKESKVSYGVAARARFFNETMTKLSGIPNDEIRKLADTAKMAKDKSHAEQMVAIVGIANELFKFYYDPNFFASQNIIGQVISILVEAIRSQPVSAVYSESTNFVTKEAENRLRICGAG